MAYFTVLLRYIHQNPVKAGLVKEAKDYEYSSWGEYTGNTEPAFQICDTQTVLKRIPLSELDNWVNEPLPNDIACLDIEETSSKRPSDDQVWQLIRNTTGVTNISAFQQLAEEEKRYLLHTLKERGASLRQLERLTGVGKGIIHRI